MPVVSDYFSFFLHLLVAVIFIFAENAAVYSFVYMIHYSFHFAGHFALHANVFHFGNLNIPVPWAEIDL